MRHFHPTTLIERCTDFAAQLQTCDILPRNYSRGKLCYDISGLILENQLLLILESPFRIEYQPHKNSINHSTVATAKTRNLEDIYSKLNLKLLEICTSAHSWPIRTLGICHSGWSRVCRSVSKDTCANKWLKRLQLSSKPKLANLAASSWNWIYLTIQQIYKRLDQHNTVCYIMARIKDHFVGGYHSKAPQPRHQSMPMKASSPIRQPDKGKTCRFKLVFSTQVYGTEGAFQRAVAAMDWKEEIKHQKDIPQAHRSTQPREPTLNLANTGRPMLNANTWLSAVSNFWINLTSWTNDVQLESLENHQVWRSKLKRIPQENIWGRDLLKKQHHWCSLGQQSILTVSSILWCAPSDVAMYLNRALPTWTFRRSFIRSPVALWARKTSLPATCCVMKAVFTLCL